MKQVYKCEIDGKVFDNMKDCLQHEFDLKGGSKRFEDEVREAIEHIENTTDLKLQLIEAKAKIGWDGDPNTDKMRYVEWQEVEIIVYHDGEQRGEVFSRGGQNYFTKEKIIEDISNEYVTPYQSKFEGHLTTNDEYYSSGFDLDGINLDQILRAMYDQNKKIRLEVIE